MTARATLSADGATVTHRNGEWSSTFPVADLPARLALYRGLWSRGAKAGQPGPYAASYEGDIAALERVERMARIFGGP